MLFLYGTLLDPELRRIVLGGVTGRPARMDGYRLVSREGPEPPVAVATVGEVTGLIVDADDTARRRANIYASAFGIEPAQVQVTEGEESFTATAHMAVGEDQGGAGWELERWQADWGALERLTAGEVMSYESGIEGEELRFRMGMARTRALSTLRARAELHPTTLRADFGISQVDISRDDRPYTHFLSVREVDLSHPLFGHGRSGVLNRAGLVSGDAVTVLPYDPARDRVLLVEQFRMGPFLRGDPLPWPLEPPAGRLDPGETAEDAGRREVKEETGLDVTRMIRVAGYYPSPGVLSEFVDSFVALADLPDAAAGLGGEDAENEDIRGHVISFDELMRLIETGEVATGPLILTALWLQRERERGRFA